MAGGTQARPDDTGRSGSALRHAFGLLAAAELGRWPDWVGPEDEGLLRERVALLALLWDAVSRSEMPRLEVVVESWGRHFPDRQPVGVARLREVARAALKPLTARPPAAAVDADSLRKALALTGSRRIAGDAIPVSPTSAADFTEADHQCAAGLYVWFNQLANDRRWRQLPVVVPGEAPTDIDKVYVELYAVSDQDASDVYNLDLERSKGLSRRLLAGQYPVVSVSTMVARTMQRCVVVGEPGSGKSTLVQWLAWAVHHQQCPDFDAALVVKLSAFADVLEKQPEVSLLEFFFQSLGTPTRDWRPAVQWLRQVAGNSRRFLLLLDGWDEVPVPLRDAVRGRILAEEPSFVTLVTSRPSGQPRQLREGERVDFYHIAGLTAAAIQQLVRNLLTALGHFDLFEPVLERVQEEPDLRDMAANPFLLGLLVRVLIRTAGEGTAPRTLADVYHQVAAWVQEQHDQAPGPAGPMRDGHVAALRRLSHGLLFEAEPPRYLFHARELAESLSGRAPEPILRSRFINRTDPLFDEYAFLHATFQEYFAAEQAAALSPSEFDSWFDRAFASASRLIVLEFVAGLGGRLATRCRARAVHCFHRRDRFQQVLLRVARLAAAGRWPAADRPGLGRALRDELWQEIRRNEDTRSRTPHAQGAGPRQLAGAVHRGFRAEVARPARAARRTADRGVAGICRV